MTDRDGCPAAKHGDRNARNNHHCQCADAIESARIYRKRHKEGRLRPARVSSIPATRKLQALTVLGWPGLVLSELLGWQYSRVHQVIRRRNPEMTVAHSREVDALFRHLWNTPGPSNSTRIRALSKGYLPAMAWDDIDDVDEVPDMRPRGNPRNIDWAEVAHLHGFGCSADEIAARLGASVTTIREGLSRRRNAA